MRRAVLVLGFLGLVTSTISCTEESATTRGGQARLEVPTVHTPDLIKQYSALGDSGYVLLEEGKVEEAVAIFSRQVELIPDGKWGAYNIACAYGRNDSVDQGIAWLTRAVDGGWGDPEHLDYDSDMESLREDPRFESLRAIAEETHEARTAAFAEGLPHYESAPDEIPDADSLQMWVEAQRRILRAHGRVWYGWQLTAARLDHEAKRLAALRSMQTEDSEFDHRLQRIRALFGIYSPYKAWGALSDGVQKEVDAYLANDPPTDGRSEAHYRAAVAAYMQKIPRETSDSDWREVAATARAHFSEVQAGTEYEGAAAAGMLMLDLKEAGEDAEDLRPRVREFAEKYGEDETAMRVASRFFHDDYLSASWPISLDAVDLDDQPVSLDQYTGKVLLIDFWAIWCGPCRAELPQLVEAHERFAARGFEILSVSLDYADHTTTDEYRDWIDENGMTWRHIYDQESWEGPLVKAFLIQSIPAPILIGRDGSIAAMGDDCRGEKLIESIEEALGKTST